MGFWRPGQEIDSAPLFLIFFTKISKMEMVDPKLISVIFNSEKKKKKKKKKHISAKTTFQKVYTEFTQPYELLLTLFAHVLRQ